MVSTGSGRPGGGWQDPVDVRRARLARLAGVGQRVGYGLVVVAVVGFAIGLVVGLENRLVGAVVVTALAGTTVTLLPAIILGYAVRAAEREDHEHRG